MSIRDVQLTNLNEMFISIDVAKYLAGTRRETLSNVMRCRLEIMMALQHGCKQLAEWRGYSVDCYGNDVYKNVDFLSGVCPDVKMLVNLYNATHPECDFARIQIANKDFAAAYELLDTYIEWLESFYQLLCAEGNKVAEDKKLDELLEHILENLGERVAISDVVAMLPDNFQSMEDEEQVECVKRICKVI